MYLDVILFAAGGALLLLALLLIIYLLRSRAKSIDYRRLLSEETERLDVITTLRQSKTAKPISGGAGQETEKLTGTATEPLPNTERIFAEPSQKYTKTEPLPDTEQILSPSLQRSAGPEFVPDT